MIPVILLLVIAVLIALAVVAVLHTPMPPVVRSFFSVLLGFFAMAVSVSLLTLLTVHALGIHSGHPTPLYLALNIVYSLTCAALGGWLTASLAPQSPSRHAAVLAGIMFAFSILGLRHGAAGQATGYLIFLAIGPPLAALAASKLPLPRRA